MGWVTPSADLGLQLLMVTGCNTHTAGKASVSHNRNRPSCPFTTMWVFTSGNQSPFGRKMLKHCLHARFRLHAKLQRPILMSIFTGTKRYLPSALIELLKLQALSANAICQAAARESTPSASLSRDPSRRPPSPVCNRILITQAIHFFQQHFCCTENDAIGRESLKPLLDISADVCTLPGLGMVPDLRHESTRV